MQPDLLLLLATLRFRLTPRLSDAGIHLCWNVQDLPPLPWLDPTYALHILRIVQEAITNIIKHAQATIISVSTNATQDFVFVVIEDNGCGFSWSEIDDKPTYGLRNQRARASTMGADVVWDSTATGTRFSLRLPLVQSAVGE